MEKKKDLKVDPMSLILGLPSRHILCNILTFANSKKITVDYRDKDPSVNGWFKDIFERVPLEYLISILHTKADQFYRVWEPDLNDLGLDFFLHFFFFYKSLLNLNSCIL